EEDYGFATRQLSKPAHDEVQRAKRAYGKDVVAVLSSLAARRLQFQQRIDKLAAGTLTSIIRAATRTGHPVDTRTCDPGFTADWSERVKASTVQVVAHPLNRRIEQALISRELLQGTHARARANDGHEVAGLHLFIHEFPESLAHVVRAFERKSEIVNCERNGSTHLVRAQSDRRRGRLGRNAFRGFSRRRGDSA